MSQVNSQASLSPRKIISSQLPKPAKFKGKLHEAWLWKDSLGDNILVLSTNGPFDVRVKETDEQGYGKEIFAYHYVKTDSGYKLLWRLNDGVPACDLDMVAEFIKGSTTITDLDKDGVAETTVQYRQSCRGDVSPSEMKVIMHENTAKYGLRGQMWVPYNEGSKFDLNDQNVNLETLKGYKGTDDEWVKQIGRYSNEKDFTNAPKEFLLYARRQWLKYAKESFE